MPGLHQRVSELERLVASAVVSTSALREEVASQASEIVALRRRVAEAEAQIERDRKALAGLCDVCRREGGVIADARRDAAKALAMVESVDDRVKRIEAEDLTPTYFK